MLSQLIAGVRSINHFLTTAEVHTTLYPFLWITTLHAATTYFDLIKPQTARVAWKKPNLGYELARHLLVSWGGIALYRFTNFNSPSQFVFIYPALNYCSAYLLLRLSTPFIVSVHPPRTLSLVSRHTFLILRALVHTWLAIFPVDFLTSHPNFPIPSIILQVLASFLAVSGGPLLIHYIDTGRFLSVTTTTQSSPPPDVAYLLSGPLAAVVYGCLTGTQPGYAPVASFLARIFGVPFAYWPEQMPGESRIQIIDYFTNIPLIRPETASAVVLIGFWVFYETRAWRLHSKTPSETVDQSQGQETEYWGGMGEVAQGRPF